MASSKSGKSSKTARVLNLLTDPDSAAEAPAEAPASPAESARLADDRRTQAKIRGALEMELAEAAAPAAPARPAMARPSAASVKAPASEAPAAAEPDPEPEPPKEAEPFMPGPPESSIGGTISALQAAGESDPEKYVCFNVTQALVEDKADKYIKMFGLCSCPRCRIDVIALALSNLPPKYVVAKPHDLVPRLSVYEQQYNAAIVTQVMSACRKVLDRPHHERDPK